MGKTYRKCHGWYRKPRGFKRAIINGARKRSIPPTSWDDIRTRNESKIYHNIIEKLILKGFSKGRIVYQMKDRWSLSTREVLDLIPRGHSVGYLARNLHKEGYNNDQIATMLSNSLDYSEEYIRQHFPNDYWSGCTCEDCYILWIKTILGIHQDHWSNCDGVQVSRDWRDGTKIIEVCRCKSWFEPNIQAALSQVEDWSLLFDNSWEIFDSHVIRRASGKVIYRLK